MSAAFAIPPIPEAMQERIQRDWEIAFLREAIAQTREQLEVLEAQLAERERRP